MTNPEVMNADIDFERVDGLMGAEPTKLAIAGDWHGNTSWATAAIEYGARNGGEALFQVGDFGLWVPGSGVGRYVRAVQTAAALNNIHVYWIDGNHEYHPDRANFGDFNTDLFTYIPRGHRWQWWDKRFMAVGGAFSIDRFMRTEGKGWWPGELLSDEDVDWACHQPHGMDVILTHDCPTGINIPGIGPDSKPRGGKDMWPPNMLAGAAEHRAKMRLIWDKHHPQYWFHGHYHVDYHIWYGPTKFYGVDCDGARGGMPANVKFLVPEDLK